MTGARSGEGNGDALDAAALAPRLATAWLGRKHVHLASCPSTNDVAAREARQGCPEGLLVTADEQSAGRGRLGRTWHAPAGANLTFSVVLRPSAAAVDIPPLTLLAGGAVAAALTALGFAARVKWPNDLLLADGGRRRKVAGILTEASTEGDRIGHVVVGVGINVNSDELPADLRDKATSLRLVGGVPVARAEVLARVLAELEPAYEAFGRRGPVAAVELWQAHADLGRPCRARVDGREIEGVSEGAASDGALLLRSADGRLHRIVSGEVFGDYD